MDYEAATIARSDIRALDERDVHEGSVRLQVELARKAVTALEHQIDQLGGALECILVASRADVATAQPTPTAECQLADQIENLTHHIGHLTGMLSDIRGRIRL